MRAGLLLIVVALAWGAQAGHPAPLAEDTETIDCLASVAIAGSAVSLNCAIQETVPTAQPAGGKYRLTATWTPLSSFWTNVRADLQTCNVECSSVSACVNESCAGSPGVIEWKTGIGPSPLVVEAKTDGPEDRVLFILRPYPLGAPGFPQGITYKLEHLG